MLCERYYCLYCLPLAATEAPSPAAEVEVEVVKVLTPRVGKREEATVEMPPPTPAKAPHPSPQA